MAKQYRVTDEIKLLPFLFRSLSDGEGWSKKTVKQRLQGSAIFVNGQIQTKHDYLLSEGDIITIGSAQHHREDVAQKLEILYQDSDIVAINKPAGLLSVGTNSENKNHALALLRTQLSRPKNSVRLWPVHRLDRDTSGILLFATSKEMREAIMDEWSSTTKVYLAIVEGTPNKKADTITEPLRLDEREYRMHVGAHRDAKPAITHYELRRSTTHRSLLEVRIETGRQHQIRAHMSWMGSPVVGDERYGKRGTRMGLHATRLDLKHPISGRDIELEVDAPSDFYSLLT